MERLVLIEDAAPVGWVATIEACQAVDALRNAVGDVRAAAHHRTVEGGVMVKSFNKLKHGFVAVARGDFAMMPGVKRDVTGNVKRWKNGKMVVRWMVAGLLDAEQRFRRVKGYREMVILRRALRKYHEGLASTRKSA